MNFFNKNTDASKNTDYMLVNNRFGIQLPDTWSDKSIYTFEGPEEDGIRHNIWVTIENNVVISDLRRYAQTHIQATENELQGYTELKQSSLILESKQPAYVHVYKWSPVENREVYQRVMYTLQNRTGYILASTFSKKTWKLFGNEIDKIFKSFTTA